MDQLVSGTSVEAPPKRPGKDLNEDRRDLSVLFKQQRELRPWMLGLQPPVI